jgi:hypothetical protein
VVTVKPGGEPLPREASRVFYLLEEAGMKAPPRSVRRLVIVLVDDSGQSALAALRYARSLRLTTVRAVHLVLDGQHAERLGASWPPDTRMPLELVDCPGRRLLRCAADLVRGEAELPGAEVTVILPRPGVSPLCGSRAGHLADVLSEVPGIAVAIVSPSRAVPDSPGHSEPT